MRIQLHMHLIFKRNAFLRKAPSLFLRSIKRKIGGQPPSSVHHPVARHSGITIRMHRPADLARISRSQRLRNLPIGSYLPGRDLLHNLVNILKETHFTYSTPLNAATQVKPSGFVLSTIMRGERQQIYADRLDQADSLASRPMLKEYQDTIIGDRVNFRCPTS